MNLQLKTIDDCAQAEALAELLDRATLESSRGFFEDGEAEEAGQFFLKQHFGAEGALVVAAQTDGETFGLALTAPFVDPLTGAMTPMLIALWVDPSIRHRGVARALVGEVRRRLGERGQAILLSRVGHNDDALISMGERWGLIRTWETMSSE